MMMWSGSLTASAPISEIRKTVNEFYGFHFREDMGFTEENVKKRRKWLSVDLYNKAVRVLSAPADPNIVPHINGDPFTDSQEYPVGFRVESVRIIKGTGIVKVVFKDPPGAKPELKWVILKLRSEDGAWKIFDIKYQDGGTLL